MLGTITATFPGALAGKQTRSGASVAMPALQVTDSLTHCTLGLLYSLFLKDQLASQKPSYLKHMKDI